MSVTKRSKIWRAMRFLRRFSLEDLQVTTEIAYRECQQYAQELYKAGYLRLCSKQSSPGQQFTYLLVRNSGPLTPSARRTEVYDPNTKMTYLCEATDTKPGREDAWSVMRAGKTFSRKSLSKRSGASLTNMHRYIRALLVAGYLEVVAPATPGTNGTPAVYRLIKDTGELAPVVQRDGSLRDPNLEELGDIDGQTTDRDS